MVAYFVFESSSQKQTHQKQNAVQAAPVVFEVSKYHSAVQRISTACSTTMRSSPSPGTIDASKLFRVGFTLMLDLCNLLEVAVYFFCLYGLSVMRKTYKESAYEI
jgi:hypothetical protein